MPRYAYPGIHIPRATLESCELGGVLLPIEPPTSVPTPDRYKPTTHRLTEPNWLLDRRQTGCGPPKSNDWGLARDGRIFHVCVCVCTLPCFRGGRCCPNVLTSLEVAMRFCFTVCATPMVQAGLAGRLVTEHVEYSSCIPCMHPTSSIVHSWNKCQIVNSRTISYD